MKKIYMEHAAAEAIESIENRHGGPFGAVVVDSMGEIVGSGHNRVISEHDPTQHAEINAIRDACEKIKSHDLSGKILYTTCYPCPMCLGAALWAGIEKIYYCCTSEDAEQIGFRDDKFYKIVQDPQELFRFLQQDKDNYKLCKDVFAKYAEDSGREPY